MFSTPLKLTLKDTKGEGTNGEEMCECLHKPSYAFEQSQEWLKCRSAEVLTGLGFTF
jgi:hypothetical protein